MQIENGNGISTDDLEIYGSPESSGSSGASRGINHESGQEQRPTTNLALDSHEEILDADTHTYMSPEPQQTDPPITFEEIAARVDGKNDDLYLSRWVGASGEVITKVFNHEIIDSIAEETIAPLNTLLNNVEAAEERGVLVTTASNNLPRSTNMHLWDDRLQMRADQTTNFLTTWDRLKDQYGFQATQFGNYIPLPSEDNVAYRAKNQMVNGGLQVDLHAIDSTEKSLQAGHIVLQNDPQAHHATVTEVQKGTNLATPSQSEIERQTAEFIEALDVLPNMKDVPVAKDADQKAQFAAICEGKGLPADIVGIIIENVAASKMRYRAEELVRQIQQKTGVRLEHTAITHVPTVLDAETVTIQTPTESAWFDPDKIFIGFGAGAIFDTEVGKRILALPPDEQRCYLEFLNNTYRVEDRAKKLEVLHKLDSALPRRLNRYLKRPIEENTFSPQTPPRLIGNAVTTTLNNYLVYGRERARLLGQLERSNLFAKDNNEMYSGVCHLMGMRAPQFNPLQLGSIDAASEEFAYQAVEVAQKSETFKQMFGAYTIPAEIATPIAQEPSGLVYRVSDLQNGINNLRKE